MSDACLFCRIQRREASSTPVYEDETIFAFRDIRPQAPTHVVIIPRQHIARLSDMASDTAPIMSQLVLAANRIAKQEGIERTGYRLVVNCGQDGGQTVFHMHVHLLGGRALGWPPG